MSSPACENRGSHAWIWLSALHAAQRNLARYTASVAHRKRKSHVLRMHWVQKISVQRLRFFVDGHEGKLGTALRGHTRENSLYFFVYALAAYKGLPSFRNRLPKSLGHRFKLRPHCIQMIEAHISYDSYCRMSKPRLEHTDSLWANRHAFCNYSLSPSPMCLSYKPFVFHYRRPPLCSTMFSYLSLAQIWKNNAGCRAGGLCIYSQTCGS